jgi:ketosteroid isomerase-like protein
VSEELIDRLAVQDVMLNYVRCVDERDDDGYRALFTDDVEVVSMGPGFNSIDEFFPWWKDAVDKYDATQHMLSPTLATIEGDTAKTRTDVQALHFPKGEEGKTLTLWATYKTDMRRVDGDWKICRHELVSRGVKIIP